MIRNILIAPDKFKFSLTARQISEIVQKNLPKSLNSKIISLADGGQGSLQAISSIVKGNFVKCRVKDPLFRHIEAQYYQSEFGHSYIQMARASGLGLLSKQQRNPLFTSTYGTGQLILDSLNKGHSKVNLLIGGSATNDGGIGVANALGYTFLDQNDKKLQPIGVNLKKIRRIIKDSSFQIIKKDSEINVYTDVQNIFTGDNGAACVYAPQKGATKEIVQQLQEGMLNLAQLFMKQYNLDINKIKGSGAAGGLGGGCHVFLNAKIQRGTDLIFQLNNFEEEVKKADLIITGQGKVDRQTIQGKVVRGVLDIALKYEKKVVVLCAFAEDGIRQYFKRYKNVQLVELFNREERNIIDGSITRRKLISFCQEYFKKIIQLNRFNILV